MTGKKSIKAEKGLAADRVNVMPVEFSCDSRING